MPGRLGILDRDAALAVFEDAEAAAVTAASIDHSHRWADQRAPSDGQDEGSAVSQATNAEPSPMEPAPAELSPAHLPEPDPVTAPEERP